MTENASSSTANNDQVNSPIPETKLREIQREADRNTYNGGRALNAIWYADISLPEKAIMLFLGSEMDFRGEFVELITVTHKRMMERLGIKDRKTIAKHIGSLEARGYLQVVRKRDQYGVLDPNGFDYGITRKFFDDYSDWLCQMAIELGVSPKASNYKRNVRYVKIESGNYSDGGLGKFPRGVGENFPPFYSSSSPKNENENENARARANTSNQNPASASLSNREQNPNQNQKPGGSQTDTHSANLPPAAPIVETPPPRVPKLTYSDYINSDGEPETWHETEQRESKTRAIPPRSKTVPIDAKKGVQDALKSCGAYGTQEEYKMFLSRLYGLYRGDDNKYIRVVQIICENWPVKSGGVKHTLGDVLANQWEGFKRHFDFHYSSLT